MEIFEQLSKIEDIFDKEDYNNLINLIEKDQLFVKFDNKTKIYELKF